MLKQRIGCGDQGGQKIHVLKLRTGCGNQEGAEKKTCVDIALKVVATRGREKKQREVFEPRNEKLC